jgi:hypothetical protein
MGLHRLGGFLLVSCHLLDVFLKALSKMALGPEHLGEKTYPLVN